MTLSPTAGARSVLAELMAHATYLLSQDVLLLLLLPLLPEELLLLMLHQLRSLIQQHLLHDGRLWLAA